MSDETINGKIIKGASYLTVGNIFIHLIKLLRVAVLARLLSPVDFGIFALAMVLRKGLEMVSAVGTQTYLVQKEKINDDFIGNIWTFNMLRGIIICLFIISISPIYSTIINEPRAASILYIIALTPLFEGITNPGKFLAIRRLSFGKVSIFELFHTLTQTIVVIGLAYFLRDVRSLAWGMVVASLISVLASFLLFSKPPSPKFHRNTFKELFSVGKYFLIIQIGAFIMIQADNLIVGMVAGTSVLGIYVIAYRACEIPLDVLRKIIGRVALPVFSRIQSDKEQLSRTIENLLRFQAAIIVPFAIFIFILAKPIIYTIYGTKWDGAVPVLQALTLVFLARGVSQIIAPYLMGTGNFKFISKIKIIEVVVFLLAVYMGASFFGAVGAALGAGIGYTVSVSFRIWFLCKNTSISFGNFLNQLNKPFICSIPGIISSLYILNKFNFEPFLQLIVLTGLVSVVYLFVSIFIQKELIYMIKSKLNSFRV